MQGRGRPRYVSAPERREGGPDVWVRGRGRRWEGCTEGEGQEHLDVQKGRKFEGQRKERGEMCVCEQKVGGGGCE